MDRPSVSMGDLFSLWKGLLHSQSGMAFLPFHFEIPGSFPYVSPLPGAIDLSF